MIIAKLQNALINVEHISYVTDIYVWDYYKNQLRFDIHFSNEKSLYFIFQPSMFGYDSTVSLDNTEFKTKIENIRLSLFSHNIDIISLDSVINLKK